MQEHLSAIKKTYQEFHSSLLRKGRLPMKDTGKGFWNPSSADDIIELCRRLSIEGKGSFIDIGSGDGIAVMIASLFTKATGIEHDPWLHEVASDIQSKLAHLPGVKEATFLNKDFLDHDLSNYGVIYLSPDQPLWRGIEQKLQDELSGTLVVAGHHFHPRSLKKKTSFVAGSTQMTLYQQN